MAKKATTKSKKAALKPRSPAVTKKSSDGGDRGSPDMGDAFVKLLQSPLVAELVAVAATAALASLAEQGFSHRGGGGGSTGKRAGRAVKAAGAAAAAAVGRRLSVEIEEIRSASKAAKGGGAAKA
jgi:hypothetical protein